MEIIDAWMQHPSAEFLPDPQVGHTDCLRDLAGLGLDDETAELFLHGNAERVFGVLPASGQAPGPGPAAGQQDTSTERAQA